ncbi:hypothetical protein KM427_06110 [Nocardioides sp. LMS-CY]|uniref:NADH-ubiquinone oxidoreductase-F iron-sulfur binding region domain-containing protein n=1 Tax=Nocardioides sp. (strain LMS-CY) TaxID=2840457 RepID=UPI001C001560|nr:NADH-ubiquinone oxidoreductase-F iron-sulfur binding region domain-containing protein [Nocardioides sp. LMS-CY]QWF23298.1 hypothetical protein KM427_06110 [Nocardioides sp. LMS-CY]
MTTTAPADPRLLLGVPDHGVGAYRSSGGYGPLPPAAAIVAAAERAGLRGAGGAGFPTAVKLDAVLSGTGPRAVVVNGEEGEPASIKDRWLMRNRPHLVLDGLRTAATAVGADRLVAYVSDPESAAALRAALAEAPAELAGASVEEVDAAYVAGEETAVVNRLSGGEAKPLRKPPRPYEEGVAGRPTLVVNVETAARLALAVREGHDAGATMLATVLIAGEAVLVEARRGAPLSAVVAEHPRWSSIEAGAVLVGGFAGGVWTTDILSAAVGHDSMRERGALWGCGALIVLDRSECVVGAALDVATYLRESSSGQCGSCVRGTQVVVEQLTRIANGTGSDDDLAQLERRAEAMAGRGNCALPDADSLLIGSLITNFSAELLAHRERSCPGCRDITLDRPGGGAVTRFRAVLPPT